MTSPASPNQSVVKMELKFGRPVCMDIFRYLVSIQVDNSVLLRSKLLEPKQITLTKFHIDLIIKYNFLLSVFL